jgi:hypothetical protein
MLDGEASCVALRAAADGSPRTDPRVLASLEARGIRALLLLDPTTSPARATWQEQLDQPHGAPRASLVMCVGSFDYAVGIGRHVLDLAGAAAWRSHLSRRLPRLEVTVGLALGRQKRAADVLPHLARPAVPFQAVWLWPGDDDPRFWRQQAATLSASPQTRHIRLVFLVWGVPENRKALSSGLLPLSNALEARQFVLARRYFPDATVVVDVEPEAFEDAHDQLRAWTLVVFVAKALAGLKHQGPVARQGPALPRLETPVAAVCEAFTGGSRRTIAMMAESRRGKAVFYPARPGVLCRVDPATPERSVETAVLSTAPLQVDIDIAPTFYMSSLR